MKKLRRIVVFLLCLVFVFAFVGCFNNDNTPDDSGNIIDDDPSGGDDDDHPTIDPFADIYAELNEERMNDVYKNVGYTPAHVSKQGQEYKSDTGRLVTFASSDEGLASFLNGYRERHMRYNDNRVHGHPVGMGQSAWKEWESMAGCWWDASAENWTLPSGFATKDIVTNWLLNPAQDKQGYIWADSGSGSSSWGLGWAFPSTNNGHEGQSWKFIDSNTRGFTADGGNISSSASGLDIAVSANNSVEIISPDIRISSVITPFIKFDMSFNNVSNTEMEDMYLYWKNDEDEDWSEEHSVAFSDFALNGYKIGNGNIAQGGYFFPMYLCDGWSWDSDVIITKFKLELKARGANNFSGMVHFDYITTDYDDRQALNPCNYIIAAKNILEYSQNASLLTQILPKARKAMNFMYNQLGGKSGLISTAYFMGHDSAREKKTNGIGIGDGYWDVLAFPNENLYCNISYYNALVAMEYLEGMAKTYNITSDKVTTVGADMKKVDEYTLTEQSLSKLVATCRERIQKEFWNAKTGRFHCGTFKDGQVLDHGYTMFNQQVISSGIATPMQTKYIMEWISGEREVEGDNSKGKDIYRYEIAPRFNTHDIGDDFAYVYSTKWDGNVQNGGSTLHAAYYDVVARSKTSIYQSNDALKRLKDLQAWYNKVEAAGGKGQQFYREYYKNSDVKLQGGQDEQGRDQNGLVGVDFEFLEAAILINAVPDAIFGLGTLSNNTLVVAPKMPDNLDWFRIENITYAGNYCDVTVGKYFARIDSVAVYKNGAVAGAKASLQLIEPTFNYKVLVNGTQTNDYTVVGGRVVVNVPFGNVAVELVEA